MSLATLRRHARAKSTKRRLWLTASSACAGYGDCATPSYDVFSKLAFLEMSIKEIHWATVGQWCFLYGPPPNVAVDKPCETRSNDSYGPPLIVAVDLPCATRSPGSHGPPLDVAEKISEVPQVQPFEKVVPGPAPPGDARPTYKVNNEPGPWAVRFVFDNAKTLSQDIDTNTDVPEDPAVPLFAPSTSSSTVPEAPAVRLATSATAPSTLPPAQVPPGTPRFDADAALASGFSLDTDPDEYFRAAQLAFDVGNFVQAAPLFAWAACGSLDPDMKNKASDLAEEAEDRGGFELIGTTGRVHPCRTVIVAPPANTTDSGQTIGAMEPLEPNSPQYSEGDKVMYYSESKRRWLETTVVAVAPIGHIRIASHGDGWVKKKDLAKKVKPAR
jgi:hypothetical protein